MSRVLYLYCGVDPALKAAATSDHLQIALMQGLVDEFLRPIGGQGLWRMGLAPTFAGVRFTREHPPKHGWAFWREREGGWQPVNPQQLPKKLQGAGKALVAHWQSWPQEASKVWQSHRLSFLGLQHHEEAAQGLQVTYFDQGGFSYLTSTKPLASPALLEVYTSTYVAAAEAAKAEGRLA